MTSNQKFSWPLFQQLPVVGVLRGFGRDVMEPLAKAAVAGGLTNLEVTMNSPGASDLIRLVRELVGKGCNVGAGTVCTLSDLDQALTAGASYIVTPVIVPHVIHKCLELQIPIIAGAMTPTEIFQAWQLGCSMVKVFPSDQLGPTYIKNVKAPLPQIKLMPTGGVTVETLPAFRQAGADAFGVGSPLFDKERVAAGDWEWITQQARRFAEAYRQG